MPKSINVKKVINFQLEDFIHYDPNDENKVIIDIIIGKSKIIENSRFYPIEIQFNKDVEKEILVDSEPVYNYQIPNRFNVYYFDQQGYLFIDAPKEVANGFTKELSSLYADDYKFEDVSFDFLKISSEDNYNAKGAWFGTDDVTVTNKAFYGNEIISDDEIDDAIKEDRVTYLMVRFDLLNQANTVGISKSGSIVILTKCFSEDDYLKLAFLSFKEVNNL